MALHVRALGVISVCGCMIGCGGAANGPHSTSRQAYEEYTCPEPIGKILREDCSRVALRYDGETFEGTVGVGGVGASASYQQKAVRQADSVIQLLKEQRVALCNNFNTCKLTVAEYREEQKRADDSFVALMSLKDRMAQLDAEQASTLLREIQSIRNGVQPAAPQAAAEPTAEKPAAAEPPHEVAPPSSERSAPPPAAQDGFACKGPAIQLFRRGTIAGPSFGYDMTRNGLKGHPELAKVDFVEFLIESGSLRGMKKEYVLVGVSPDEATAQSLKSTVRSFSPSAGVDIPCPAIPPVRSLNFDVQ